MICRVWRGWAQRENAATYERLMREVNMPRIAANAYLGFHGIELLKRDLGDEIEFATLMWFDDMDRVRAYAGPDFALANILPEARAVLARCEETVSHYQVVERR